MSVQATSWAYEQEVKPCGCKFVLVALANFADAEGRCYPSQNTLAKMTGQSERSVRQHLYDLEHTFDLIKRFEMRRHDGGRTSDDYVLQAPEEVLDPGLGNERKGGRRHASPPPAKSAGGSRRNLPPPPAKSAGDPPAKSAGRELSVKEPSVKERERWPFDIERTVEKQRKLSLLKKELKDPKLTQLLLERKRFRVLELPLEKIKAATDTLAKTPGNPVTNFSKMLDQLLNLRGDNTKVVPGAAHESDHDRAEREAQKQRSWLAARAAQDEVVKRLEDNGVDSDEANGFGQAMYQFKLTNNVRMLESLEQQIKRRILSAQAQALALDQRSERYSEA